MDFRVTYHTALADKILANLELRFHQQNPVGAVRAEGAQWFGDDPDRDKRQVGDDEIKRRTELRRIDMTDVGALDDLDPIVTAQLMVELAVADVESNDTVRSPLQKTVGETSRRRAYVDSAPPAYRDGELLDGVIELVSAPSDEAVGLADQIQRIPWGNERARLRIGDPADANATFLDRLSCCRTAGDELAANQLDVEAPSVGQPSPPVVRPMSSSSASNRSASASAISGASAASAVSRSASVREESSTGGGGEGSLVIRSLLPTECRLRSTKYQVPECQLPLVTLPSVATNVAMIWVALCRHRPGLSVQARRVGPVTRRAAGEVGLLDVERVVALDNPASAKRQHHGQAFVKGVEARDLLKTTLWSAHHPARLHVIPRAVPRAHQAPCVVDAAVG